MKYGFKFCLHDIFEFSYVIKPKDYVKKTNSN